ncbi:hypothetical protein [Botrimarina hoheduenensis]|nr:hypothetical protein [Botrimarina hoheduenensis]
MSLDRAQFFNHWGQLTPGADTNLGDLQTAVHSPTDLHSFSGRETNDFTIGMYRQWGVDLPEDPNRPGYFDHAALVSKLQNNTNTWGFKYRALQSDAWRSLRNTPNPIYVTGGREGGFYPDFIDGGTDRVINFPGYADFINVFLEEVVYGEGPGQGYLPFDKDRFYVEIMNEPNWKASNSSAWQDVIAMHRVVTELVKEEHPQAQLGGPSCCDGFNENPLNDWDRAKALMDDMATWRTPSGQPAELDFWTLHPYERYNVLSDGSWEQQVDTSPGRVGASMDLFETYSNIKFGDPKAFAITEYGSFNQTAIKNGPGTADDNYGTYTRAEQQWDLVRDVREKLMVFMGRPDRIVNATPFLAPIWWELQTPTSPAGDNVFWERDAQGVWHETIVAGMYRMHNDLSGEYVVVDSSNPDVQTHAFRNGNKLYLMLNNLENALTSVNLQAVTGAAAVTTASIDRIYWDGAKGVYESNVDITANWSTLQMMPDEGAVLTLTLSEAALYDYATDIRTYYGDDVVAPLNLPGGQSKAINIAASTQDALSAKIRVSYNREGVSGASRGEAFSLIVNGNVLSVPAGLFEFDEKDNHYVAREVDVPLSLLKNGANTVFADFDSTGGYLISATLEITHSVGDFNRSGAFDGEDLAMLFGEFGPADTGSRYDLDADGTVDAEDVRFWSEQLRGVATPTGDFNGDGAVDAADYTVIRDLSGTEFQFDYQHWRNRFGAVAPVSGSAGVPEPSTVVLAVLGLMAAVRQSSRGHNDR